MMKMGQYFRPIPGQIAPTGSFARSAPRPPPPPPPRGGAHDQGEPWRRGTWRGPDPVLCASSYIGGLRGSTKEYRFDWTARASTALVRSVLTYRAHQAGLGHVAPHDLRRSFAGFLDDRGADLRTIQTALRHGSPDTTVRHYLIPNPTRALRAVEALQLREAA